MSPALLAILLELLVKFLVALFKGWLFPEADLRPYRAQFMAKVKWRFWLGPDRMTVAGAAFDKVAAKFNTVAQGTYIRDCLKTNQEKKLADMLCSGIDVHESDVMLNG